MFGVCEMCSLITEEKQSNLICMAHDSVQNPCQLGIIGGMYPVRVLQGQRCYLESSMLLMNPAFQTTSDSSALYDSNVATPENVAGDIILLITTVLLFVLKAYTTSQGKSCRQTAKILKVASTNTHGHLAIWIVSTRLSRQGILSEWQFSCHPLPQHGGVCKSGHGYSVYYNILHGLMKIMIK